MSMAFTLKPNLTILKQFAPWDIIVKLAKMLKRF